MALELFVDIITATISLRVKNKPVKPSKAYYSNDKFLSYPRENPSSSYISNASINYFPSNTFVKVLVQHYFDGIDSAIFPGFPFVLNIISINVKPYNIDIYPSSTYSMSSTSLIIPKLDSTSTYNANLSKIYLPDAQDINVLTNEDNLELDYNLSRNFVEPIELQSVEENNNENNQNSTSTLKEFWA